MLETLVDRLRQAAKSDNPDHGIRFLDGKADRYYSFQELLGRVQRAAGSLRKAGVRVGDRVPLIIPTCVEFFDAFFGIMALGAIPVPLYPPVRLGRLEEYYDRTAAMAAAVKGVALVAPAGVRSLLGQVVARYRPEHGVIASESLSNGALVEPYEGSQDEMAFIQFSSGTTVDPKPVGLTHLQVQANMDAFLQYLEPHLPPDPVGLSWLPLYHDLGLIGNLLVAVLRPGPLVLLPPEQFLARPRLWLQAISRYKASISSAPNFAYAYCIDRITDADMEGCDLSCWRFAMNGAEPVSASVLRRFAEKFGRWGFNLDAFKPVYGLAEATVGVTVTPLERPFHSRKLDRQALLRGEAVEGNDVEVVSVGTPLEGVKVQIRGDNGPLLEGQVGHIWVQGTSVASRYVDRPEDLLTDGWLDTGDLGFMAGEDLYVTGRAKDVIILRGENHAPHDIERVVDRVDGIRTGCVAAVGCPDPEGERLVVLAEVREERPGLEDECRKAIMSAIGVAADVHLLEPGALPRTSSGKIRRQEARRRFETGTLSGPARVTPLMMGRAWLDNLKGYHKRP